MTAEEVSYYGMFTDEGNNLVEEAVLALIEALQRIKNKHKEVEDTAVREHIVRKLLRTI